MSLDVYYYDMSMTVVLIFTILLCSLISGVQTHESKAAQGGALALVVVSAFELLLLRDGLPRFWGRDLAEQVVPPLVVGLALLTTFNARERTLSLVLIFAALLHFFTAVGVIDEL